MKVFILFCFISIIPSAICQSMHSNSFTAKSDSAFRDTTHSIKKATLLSTFLPGAGQIYNSMARPRGERHAYWKVPLFLGIIGYMGYNLYYNQTTVNSLRAEYNSRIDGNPSSNQWIAFDNQNLILLESQFASSRDRSILGFILAYGIQVADAAVEAHFVNFDVSDDLSLRFKPLNFPNAVGMGIQLNFR